MDKKITKMGIVPNEYVFARTRESATIEWEMATNNPKLLENDQLMKFHIGANPPSLDKWGADNGGFRSVQPLQRCPPAKGDCIY
jgi:type I restriction enzyme M protein